MIGVKRQCPLCSVSFYNIPRHLREEHRVSSTSPVYNYLIKFTQEKHHVSSTSPVYNYSSKFKQSSSKPNNGVEYLLYSCPVENCTSPRVKRLDKHLQSVHAMRYGTPEYEELRSGMIGRVSYNSSHDETCRYGNVEGVEVVHDEGVEAVDVDHNEEDAEEASNGVDFNISISDGSSKVDRLKSFCPSLCAWLRSITLCNTV